MKLVILMFGSYGDHVPPWEIAKEARRRGHDVTVIGNAKYLNRLDPASIETHAVVTEEEANYRVKVIAEASWSQKGVVFRESCINFLRRSHEILRRYGTMDDVVLLSPYGPGGLPAEICHELVDVPVMEFYVDPFGTLSSAAGWRARLFKWVMKHTVEGVIRQEVNIFRKELGLPAVRDLAQWSNDQIAVGCGFFPEFVAKARPFAAPRQRFLMPGFIPRDPALEESLPASVQNFLDAGPPPVVVTRPSWSAETARFLEETTATLKSMGLRGVFTGSSDEQASTTELLHVPFVSYPHLLARAKAFIHHGGAGTVGAALLAGIPQIIVPQLPMQSDFGLRVRALGVGDMLEQSAYRRDRIAHTLQTLTESPTVTERCREYAAQLRTPGPSAVQICCDELERLHRERNPSRTW